MIELHGWITVHETYKNTDENDKVFDDIKNILKKIDLLEDQIKYGFLNGNFYINFTHFSNRKGKRTNLILKLLNQIGIIANGSYGMIYLRDDEDTNGNDNEFEVYVLSRGRVRIEQDVFLSPCIPTIEDLVE